MDPRVADIASSSSTELVETVVVLRSPERPPPFPCRTQFGAVVTARLHPADLRRVVHLPQVLHLSVGRRVAPALHEIYPVDSAEVMPSAPTTNPRAGSGVVIGFLDWGADFTHRAFRDVCGNSRILALWDQRNRKNDSVYGYGTVHSKADINRALRRQRPFNALDYVPMTDQRPAHGTHVMDIAAGSLRDRHGSLAPAADLVFVHLSSTRPGPEGDLGDSVRILEALDFVLRTAGDRPCVINMSLGSTGGSHVGRSPVELAIDHIVTARPGRAIVQSAGNYRQWDTHAEGRLTPGQRRVLRWIVDEDDTTPNELELWFDHRDQFKIDVTSPSGQHFTARPNSKCLLRVDGKPIGRLHHDAPDRLTGDQRVVVYLLPAAESGTWKVRLTARTIHDGRFHAWIERDSAQDHAQSRFAREDASDNSTVGTIATSHWGITVGAYDARSPEHLVATFSSTGPTRDGRIKPDLVGPGVAISAALSRIDESEAINTDVIAMSGTSMASPRIAGCIAAVFSEVLPKQLSINETRQLIFSAATKAPGVPNHYGNGYLNVEAALYSATELSCWPKPKLGVAMFEQQPPSHQSDLNPDQLFRSIIDQKLNHNRLALIGAPGSKPVHSLTPTDIVVTVAPGESVRGNIRLLRDFPNGTLEILDTDGRLPLYRAVVRNTHRSDLIQPDNLPNLFSWSELMSFIPSSRLLAPLHARVGRVLLLVDGVGDINLDYYSVIIDRMPRGLSDPTQLLRSIRLNINGLIDTTLAQFSPEQERDNRRWSSTSPRGAIMHIQMFPDEGSVLCSDASPRHWRFTTIFTREDLNHPVSGNREWGIRSRARGGWIFYNRGADRITRLLTLPLHSIIFGKGHALWLSFQHGVANMINRSGGRARLGRQSSRRFDWDTVRGSGYYQPSSRPSHRRVPYPSLPARARGEQQITPRPAQINARVIPISPRHGGRSIGTNLLAVADIIVSTTPAIVSRAIRTVTRSPVSHAMLYIGDNLVVEAIGSGVVMRPIDEALADASLAVAARDETLTPQQALQVRDFAGQQIGRRYNYGGVVRAGAFQLLRQWARRDRSGIRVDLGRGDDDSFFCSELILAAFANAGRPLGQLVPDTSAPANLARLILTHRLSYIGHLKA